MVHVASHTPALPVLVQHLQHAEPCSPYSVSMNGGCDRTMHKADHRSTACLNCRSSSSLNRTMLLQLAIKAVSRAIRATQHTESMLRRTAHTVRVTKAHARVASENMRRATQPKRACKRAVVRKRHRGAAGKLGGQQPAACHKQSDLTGELLSSKPPNADVTDRTTPIADTTALRRIVSRVRRRCRAVSANLASRSNLGPTTARPGRRRALRRCRTRSARLLLPWQARRRTWASVAALAALRRPRAVPRRSRVGPKAWAPRGASRQARHAH